MPLVVFLPGAPTGFGVPSGNAGAESVRSGDDPLHASASTSSVALAAPSAAASRIVAEYDPVRIDKLPLHAARPGDEPQLGGSDLTLITKGVLRAGESLSASLRRQGITSATIHLIVREMGPLFDFRRSLPGDRYRLGQDPEGMVREFRYWTGPEKSYSLRWQDDDYAVSEDVAQLRVQLAKISGLVETSLYDAVKALGEQSQLATDFADIFAWDIDFSRSVRPGDDFQILYERLYRSDHEGGEVYVRPGRILAARYQGRAGLFAAVYFEGEDGVGTYYRPDGSSIERALLRSPLEYSRISSSFSRARRHPILNVVRAHPGIDYAAKKGTPIWAVGDGTVIFRGWAGASGNLVKVRHAGGYVSQYAHLSGFAEGLRVGQSVRQKEVIGFVGDTGLATGPHVCFRMQRHGRYVNPLEIASPAGNSVSGSDWKSFELRRDLLLGDLGSGTLVAADEAL